MLGTSTLATVLSGKGKVADVAAFALRAGLAIVLDKPGTKQPMCILGPRKLNEADREAVLLAASEGKPRADRARHACGIGHVLYGETDATNVRGLVARLERRWGERINLGIEPGRSRLLVVDVDTPEEEASFKRWLASHGALGPQMTVRSPGKKQVDGKWVHKDGGHYWFTLPDGVTLPIHGDTGVLKLGDGAGFSAVWANRQVLIPPSVREEGAYIFTGAPIVTAPAALIEAIQTEVIRRTATAEQRLAERLESEPTSIDLWDAQTPWRDVLLPDGWTETGKADNCGCPIWTAPGQHDSPKSATAHDAGCMRWDTAEGWGPLHIWTDNPPEQLRGKRNWTKLQYLAAMAGERVGEMARELGLIERPDELEEFDPDPFSGGQPESVASPVPDDARELTPEVATAPTTDLFEDPDTGDYPQVSGDYPPTTEVTTLPTTGIVTHTLSQMRDRGQRAPDLVAGMIGSSGLSRIIGKSNEGKTFVAVDIAACVATGHAWAGRAVSQGGVLYVNYEDNDGLMDRFLAWDAAHDGLLGEHEDQLRVVDPVSDIFISEPSKEAKQRRNEFGRMIRDTGARLVIFDTQSMATIGADENDSTEMNRAVMWLKGVVARVPNCQLMLIHHRGHNGEHGRGSTAVYAAMDTELSVSRPDRDKPEIVVSTTKQRAMAFAPDVTVRLASVAVEGLERTQGVIEHGDPFEDPAPVKKTHVPAPVTLPDDATWTDAALAAIAFELADLDSFTKPEAARALLMVGNLPAVKVKPGRTEVGAQRQYAGSAIHKLISQELIEDIDGGRTGPRFVLTATGGTRALAALERCVIAADG